MDRESKQQKIERIRFLFGQYPSCVLIHDGGMKVSEVSKLRVRLRADGSMIMMMKNRLAKVVINNSEVINRNLCDFLVGNIMFVFAHDFVALCKLVFEYSIEFKDKIKIVQGLNDNNLIGVSDIERIAKLPSIDVLRAEFCFTLSAPLSSAINVLSAPFNEFIRLLDIRCDNN